MEALNCSFILFSFAPLFLKTLLQNPSCSRPYLYGLFLVAEVPIKRRLKGIFMQIHEVHCRSVRLAVSKL